MTDTNPAAEGLTADVETVDVKTENPAAEAAISETADTPATDDAPEGDEEAAKRQALSEEAKKIHAYEKRIARQTARAKETERLLKEAQDRLLGYEKTKPADGKPKQEDYQTIEEYLKAEGAWEAEQKFKQDQDKKAQEQKAAEYQKSVAEKQKVFEAKEAEFRKVAADYDTVVQGLNDFIADLSPQQNASLEMQVFRDVMFDSENMPALSYELAKNPELMEEMLTMHPLQIAKTLWKLENQIAAAPKPTAIPPKAPPTPISGKGSSPKSVEQMGGKELLKWMDSK